jgi:phosphatidylserine/phosphatidylglycerophosphate/cardiolipin synthase-like enzyme
VEYQPVVRVRSNALAVSALVGAHTAVFGFDLPGGAAQATGLLGIAIRRTSLADGAVEWLRNPLKFKRAPFPNRFNIAGTPSNLAPIQQFRWADHYLDNQADSAYRYEFFLCKGDPAAPTVQRPPTTLTLVPAPDDGPTRGPSLSLYFNRGVVATPAYRQRFDNVRPGQAVAEAEQAAHYLSRGLWEALLRFIDAAQPGDGLDVAVYELHHPSLVAALQAAIDRGVRLRLLYHAAPHDAGQRSATLTRAQAQSLRPAPDPALPAPEVRPRRSVPRLSHNKFIVHTRDGAPAAVWTGSANFTESGLFLQTNVGMVLRDAAVAQAYAAAFALLFEDPDRRDVGSKFAALPLRDLAPGIPRLFFSPVAGDDLLRIAAEMIAGAQDMVLLSCPFGLEEDGAILHAIRALDPRVVVYGLLNSTQRGDLAVLDRDGADAQVFAVPDWLKQLNGEAHDARIGSGNQIHIKSLVVDPYGLRPRVLLGSANFSGESVNQNDENMLLIEGDRWVAAQVATEFLRVFEHYRFRNHIRRIAERVDTQPPTSSELAVGGWSGGVLGTRSTANDAWLLDLDALPPQPSGVLGAVTYDGYWLIEGDAWARPYFDPADARSRERTAFAT